MLGQRLETTLKSQTLPRLDGQDEEGDGLENQFEILSLVNSCPDLTVLEIEAISNETEEIRVSPVTISGGRDEVDGIFYKNSAPPKISASFRRSTSLNSLGVDLNRRQTVSTVDGNAVSIVQPGPVSKVRGHLEKSLKKDISCQQSTADFLRANLRASHVCATGYLHKSISSPSVTQYFVGVSGGAGDVPHKQHRTAQSDAHQHSSKRSFFRRKHKSKASLNSHPPSVPQFFNSKMDGNPSTIWSSTNGEGSQSLGLAALTDPTLGLQDIDAECWALSMSSDVVGRLDDKEVKRQEHMYELIITEKHHCLTLALMQHLFVGGMKKAGFYRQTRLLFPDLNKLLEIHFSFFRRMRERQTKFRDLSQPLDTLADILVDQFTTDQWQIMIRLYGLLCASHAKSLEIFKGLLKDQKFASLVALWDKEPLLSRKNVRECLLLVAQRITKYPLLFEPLLKTSVSVQEKEQISKALISSKDLISKVNERVAERQRLIEICQRIDPKSYVIVGTKRRGREDIISVPSRRLLFHGQAIINRVGTSNTGGGGAPGSFRNIPCTVLILTDALIFTQEFSGRLHLLTPPGMVMLNNLIFRTNAGQTSSLFLVPVTGTAKPEMIDLQVINPPNREVWMDQMRNAISKCEEEAETCSDGDDETIDTSDFSDLKTTRALEELQEQDKNLLNSLRSRGKLIDGLRSEKPHHWISNNLDGKDGLLNSLSLTCTEVQRVLNLWESNANNGVNRSTSCVSEHVTPGILSGLPKRADTFGGFDSQQRSALDLPQSANSRLLFEIVIQLSDLCGEMFSQMVPQLMPNVYQGHHQLQRRMEDLREAQQRLETEKALWQQDLSSQKHSIEKERNELNSLKQSLQKEQDDIIQQREQLYRKLEALQKQGIRPPLDPISPLGTSTAEKVPVNSVTSRRQVSQPQQPTSSVPATGQTINGVKNKQQLPLHLAAFSSFKASKSGSSNSDLASTSNFRSSMMGSFKVNPTTSSSTVTQNSPQSFNEASRVNQNPRAPAPSRNSNSQSIQQLLPLRLSEGNSNKTSSLPRGVGSRSVASMMNQMDSQQMPQSNSQLRTSVSSSQFPQGGSVNSVGENLSQPNSSFLYGPANTGGTKTYNHSDSQQNPQARDGCTEYYVHQTRNATHDAAPIIHRRSDSSPVPMSSAPVRKPPAPDIHYHQHPFFKPRDDDSESKILFL